MAGESKERHRLEGARAQQCGGSCLTKQAYELIPSPEKRPRNRANAFSVSLSSAHCPIQTSQLFFLPVHDKRRDVPAMFSTPGAWHCLALARGHSTWLPWGSDSCTQSPPQGGGISPGMKLSFSFSSLCCAGSDLSPAGPGPCC